MPTSEVTSLEAVVDGLVVNGIHAFTGSETADEARERVAAAGWLALTANAAAGKAALLDGLGSSGGFPEYFGRNWDALSDCLVDLSWAPADGYVVLVEGWAAFAAAWPRDAEIAREVLDHAADEWSARGNPFVVLTR